jgi:Tfp pilus assembly protein PilE
MNLLSKFTLNNLLKIIAIIGILFITISISYYFLINKPKLENQKLALEKQKQEAEELAKKEAEANDLIYAKNKECQSYQSEIEKRLKEKNIELTNSAMINYLDKIFYSPKINSCFYTYKTIAANTINNDLDIVVENYYLINIFTNETILSIKTKGTQDPLYQSEISNFNDSVDLYKK